MVQGIVGVKTTKVFVREAENLRDFDGLIDEMRGHSVHNAILSAVYLPIILTLGSVAIALALAIGGYQASVGVISVGEVVMVLVWQTLQAAWLKRVSPMVTARVMGPRGGTFVARMNWARASTLCPSFSGSAVGSHAPVVPGGHGGTTLPFELFSVAKFVKPLTRLVIPISLRYSSPENDNRLAC